MDEDEAPKYLGDEVQLSNKSCPRYYSVFDVGTISVRKQSKLCRCPHQRCWYDEQKSRRAEGKQALDPNYWLRVIQGGETVD